FDRWLAWCSACKHSGHTECVSAWFSLHQACPVPGCRCRCASKQTPIPHRIVE
ncbi:hypothetical protein GQ42DRAFT_129678, partial [Ramicandelaber brevisporus]